MFEWTAIKTRTRCALSASRRKRRRSNLPAPAESNLTTVLRKEFTPGADNGGNKHESFSDCVSSDGSDGGAADCGRCPGRPEWNEDGPRFRHLWQCDRLFFFRQDCVDVERSKARFS